MNLAEYVKRSKEEYEKLNPPDFVTHHNYVMHLKALARNLSIDTSLKFKEKFILPKEINKKLSLLRLTLKGIENESDVISENPEYSIICVSWISVKSYYLLFNMLCTLKLLINCDKKAFSCSHFNIINTFKGYLKRRELFFNNNEFNNIYKAEDILKWKAKSGANIKRNSPDYAERFNQILKKLVNYKLEEFQRQKKIPNFRNKTDRKKKEDFISKTDINLCEFFYWYRIKANYRDLEFLDKDIDIMDFKNFYSDYFDLTVSFYNAIKDVINKLALQRIGRKLID